MMFARLLTTVMTVGVVIAGCAVSEDEDDTNLGSTSSALDAANWGLLANPGLDQQPAKATFFFSGSAKNGDISYGQGYGPNLGLYTYYPQNTKHLHWSDSEANRLFALDAMGAAHINMINMSFWGPDSKKSWVCAAPMQTSVQSNDELFTTALSRNIVIQPVIEEYDADALDPVNCPEYYFHKSFPVDSEGKLLERIQFLVQRYLKSPTAMNTGWPSRWAQMYDRTGTKRYALHLYDVWSSQISNVDPTRHQVFADRFDAIALQIENEYGIKIGFTLDVQADVGGTAYVPTPEGVGSFLRNRNSILAIQPFRDEIHAPNTDAARIAYKRDFFNRWVATGVPVILDVNSGYDGHIVFSGSPIYGSNDTWRNDQGQLKGNGNKGITFSAWNGFTEGWFGMTVDRPGRDNTPAYAMEVWLQNLFSGDPRDCDTWQNQGGVPMYHIYGDICRKWYQLQGSRGFLGSAAGSEANGCGSNKRTGFSGGHIVWSPTYGAFEQHGLIDQKYNSLNLDCSPLGAPKSDEEDGCNGHKRNRFESGTIVFSGAGTFEVHGSIYSKYLSMGLDCSGLGAPTNNESTACGHYRSTFEGGSLIVDVSSPWATYGLIGTLYKNMGYDCSWLGAPTNDETVSSAWCAGGKFNHFQGGWIDYCPNGHVWAHSDPNQGWPGRAHL